jgi:hypothetical protein
MTQVSIISNTNGTNRVHGAGCADVAKDVKKFKNDAWTIEVHSREELALAIWSDIAGDHNPVGSDEHKAEAIDLLTGDEILPCVGELPETSAPANAIGVTRYSPNGHFLKADGTSFKTICGSSPKDVKREAEFTGSMCTRCTKAVEKGQTPLTVAQFDWSGEIARLIVSAVEDEAPAVETKMVKVPGLSISVPAVEDAKPEPKAVAKKTTAKRKAAKAPATAAEFSATAKELLEFVEMAAGRVVLTKAQKSSYRTVTRRLMGAQFGEESWESADVFGASLDTLDATFRKADPSKSEITYKVYKGDFRKALEFFTAYLADKDAWNKAHPAKAAK